MFNWYQYIDYAMIKTVKKNTSLYRQGERIDGFYYVHQGTISISVLREDGYERIIDLVYPGSLIGEQMINGSASFTNANALIASTLYYFSTEQFELLSKNDQEASHQFGLSLISKVRLMANINTILNAPVEVQLAHFLLHLAKKKQTKNISINQTSLSKYIGKSRVSIWKVLKEWRQDGLIEMERQQIILNDLDKISDIGSF